MPALPRKRSQPRDVKFLTKFANPDDLSASLYDDHQTIEDAFAKLRQEIRDANDDAEIAALDQRIAALEERPEGTTVVNNDNSTTVVGGEPTPDELTKDQKDAIKGTAGTPNDNNRFVTDQDPRLGVGAMPIGAVIDFAGTVAPGDWLLCDGSLKNQADYPALFAVIGSTYGVVDPVTFSLPDCRGRSTMGAGTGPGLTARAVADKLGVEQHLLTAAQSGLPQHNHPVSINAIVDTATNGNDGGHLKQAAGSPVTGDAGPLNASQAHPNIHPVIVFTKIIKAK